MYLLFVAIILGIVEGVTEFIPVSSTGHLILAGNMLGFIGEKANNFEVVIQLGAILAIAVLYWKRLINMLNPKEMFSRAKDRLNVWHIFVAIIPAFILGFLLNNYIDEHLFSTGTVIIGLVLGSFFMIFVEKYFSKAKVKDIDKISFCQAFFIGVSQCLSLWPGFSRSGATICGGMIFGLDRKAAAEFSFIVAIPIMVGASALKMFKIWNQLNFNDLTILSIGFIISFIVAYLAVIFFLKLLNNHTLKAFSYYRLALAAIALLYFYG